jgi:hypothetical protein
MEELKKQGWFPSHGKGCQATRGFWLCGSYTRYPILPSGRKEVRIRRIRCCAGKKTLSVLPTFVMPYKHFGTFLIANSLENWLIRNNTARDTLCIANVWLKDHPIRSQSTLYGWLKDFGQMKLTSLALQLDLKAPEFLSPDEKFRKAI